MQLENKTEIVLPESCTREDFYNQSIYVNLKFWGPGVSVSVLGCIGLAGNLLSIIAIASMVKPRLSLFYKVSISPESGQCLAVGNIVVPAWIEEPVNMAIFYFYERKVGCQRRYTPAIAYSAAGGDWPIKSAITRELLTQHSNNNNNNNKVPCRLRDISQLASLGDFSKAVFGHLNWSILIFQLLVTLAIFDILFISNGGLFMIQQAFRFNVSWYNTLFPKCIYPISGFAMTGKY